ncbi:MAG: M20 family metallo-hydrolase [Anaerolineae bacterium]|nr:M20 family metallo-hydrolase [Anaerolineae bacterium]
MSNAQNSLNPKRTVAELKELRALTGDENGAQRVAWTDTWAKSRAWLKEKALAIPGVTHQMDEAGNYWFTLKGKSKKELLIGGHMDSVPNGGWLDGCLNVMAGIEVLRRIASDGTPPVTVRVVDWADEEGARFGRSLLGSSSVSGAMDPAEVALLKDRNGITYPRNALAQSFGVSLKTAKRDGQAD